MSAIRCVLHARQRAGWSTFSAQSSAPTDGEFSRPLCVATNTLCRLLLLTTIFVDAIATRRRLARLAFVCASWLRLLVVQLVAPQASSTTEVCLVYCANIDAMAHGSKPRL